jgi:hypothetical protein
MSIERRKRQGETLLRWIWTGLTGSEEELRELGTDAAQDVQRQVEERRRARVLNEGHRVEPAAAPDGKDPR